jgi:uncharacterized membrane protein
MKQPILALTLGILCAALFVDAVSVYIFHDVDHDQIGHWNEAFLGLCQESTVAALLIGGVTGLITSLGRAILKPKHGYPRTTFAFLLGVAVSVIQYPWDVATRALLPAFAQTSLLIFLFMAPVVCAFLLLRDSRSQPTSAPIL